MTLRLAALEQKSACLNPKKEHIKEEGNLPCSYVVLHARSKLLAPRHSELFSLFLLTLLKLYNPKPWSHLWFWKFQKKNKKQKTGSFNSQKIQKNLELDVPLFSDFSEKTQNFEFYRNIFD